MTGNTAIDALNYTVNEDYQSEILEKHKNKKILLLTAHRRENLGEPMENIFKAVRKLADEDESLVVVYPVHMNPKVRNIAQEILGIMKE